MAALVQTAGGTVTHNLHIINAVGAYLTPAQLEKTLASKLVTRHIADLSDPKDTETPPEEDEEDCRVRGHLQADIDRQSLSWKLYNKKPETAFLERLLIAWPEQLGTIEEIRVGNFDIDPNWHASRQNLYQPIHKKEAYQVTRIQPLKRRQLLMEFTREARPQIALQSQMTVTFQHDGQRTDPSRYQQRDFQIEANFHGDCFTELLPAYDNNHDDFYYNRVGGIETLHAEGITGEGVTVAVIDSGLWEHPRLTHDTRGNPRILARYNAIIDNEGHTHDDGGHGTHMSSIIAHSGPTLRDGKAINSFKGVAPDANLVVVKVLNKAGYGHLFSLVRAVQWVVDNREAYNIRVLNLSFAQDPRWRYWEDPVNQAVMRAWAAGITVVAAAGNEGPEPGTIGSPGNLPYIITAGALTDSWTPETRSDDYIPDFSSQGPTHSGHIKPDLVGLGGHMTGLTPASATLAMAQPEDVLRTGEFVSSGSSQASAYIAGNIALLLQIEPDLTPDDVKCKFTSSAEPAINRDGLLAYSPFQQGYGQISVRRAITLGERGCSNVDLDIQADISGREHFEGPALVDDNGKPTLPGLAVAPFPSQRGLSEIRKWGLKAHIERLNGLETDQLGYYNGYVNWFKLYLEEKDRIEKLAIPTP